MTEPNASSPDPGINPDEAAWLDLVSRLEGGTGTSDSAAGAAEAAPAGRAFRDFDPLGLSTPAPTELSAAERTMAADKAPAPAQADGSDSSGPRDFELEEEDEGFIPEEPPSLAGTEPLTMLAWIGAVGGPVALLLSAMFWRTAPLPAILGIVAAFAVAVIYLMMKLPTDKDEHDDGARV